MDFYFLFQKEIYFNQCVDKRLQKSAASKNDTIYEKHINIWQLSVETGDIERESKNEYERKCCAALTPSIARNLH